MKSIVRILFMALWNKFINKEGKRGGGSEEKSKEDIWWEMRNEII